MLKSPEDTLYGPRTAFWLIDGNIFPKPNGKGSFRLITPSASKFELARGDIHLPYREMTDIPGRLRDMDKLGSTRWYLTLFRSTSPTTRPGRRHGARLQSLHRQPAPSPASACVVVVLPLHSTEESVKEISGKDNGAVGVFRGVEGAH
jgi:hypothetical protein